MKKIILLMVAGIVTLLSAESLRSSENVRVISSTPEYKQVNVRVPYEEVVEVPQRVQVPCQNQYNQDSNNMKIDLGTIVGAVAGVAIGNQIGKGNGRTAAKIVGGLGGAYTANRVTNGYSNNNSCTEVRMVKSVRTSYDYMQKEKLVGYKNVFKYKGKTYTKNSRQQLKNIRVTTTISF